MRYKTTKGYYDIESEALEQMLTGCGVSELLYFRDLQQRKLFVSDNISQYTIGDVVRQIMQINCEDKGIAPEDRQPILLYVTSNGGSVDDGFELIDAILNSKTPVYTVNLGYQYSMGFYIGLAGHKRFATKHSKFLMHDGSSVVWDSSAKAQDRMEFYKRGETRIRDYVLERTRISPEEYDANLRVEWYLFADEAKDKGVVDFIIGEDCDIDDIV